MRTDTERLFSEDQHFLRHISKAEFDSLMETGDYEEVAEQRLVKGVREIRVIGLKRKGGRPSSARFSNTGISSAECLAAVGITRGGATGDPPDKNQVLFAQNKVHVWGRQNHAMFRRLRRLISQQEADRAVADGFLANRIEQIAKGQKGNNPRRVPRSSKARQRRGMAGRNDG